MRNLRGGLSDTDVSDSQSELGRGRRRTDSFDSGEEDVDPEPYAVQEYDEGLFFQMDVPVRSRVRATFVVPSQ